MTFQNIGYNLPQYQSIRNEIYNNKVAWGSHRINYATNEVLLHLLDALEKDILELKTKQSPTYLPASPYRLNR